MGNHRGHERHDDLATMSTEESPGYPIPGVPFQIFLSKGKKSVEEVQLTEAQIDQAINTVADAFSIMVEHRHKYKRFDEALRKDVLKKIIIEPKVFNRGGKEFSFLVARMKHKGQVKLLINASALDQKGYLGHPEQLVPQLAREFQWVVSKAATQKQRKTVMITRQLTTAPIHSNKNIQNMSENEREEALQALLDSYLTTVDDYSSLNNQPFYDVGSSTAQLGEQADSSTKLYDIRVREALQRIVSDPYFQEHTPKAVRSLLNGKIWNVAFVRIDERDWATRTRVLPKDKAIQAGEPAKSIQPAKILVNVHRQAAPEDPFFKETNGLPMGALSTDQLARVIAWEIQDNIVEKSMRGHVAQDELSAPGK